MDPVSIAGAVGPTLKILYTVTTTLYSFITSAKKVDKSLENLNIEVRGLIRVLEDIETFLKDVTIAQTSHATSRKDGVWGPIYRAIQDTQRTIEALQEVLDRLGPPSRVTNGFKKTMKQIQLDFNSNEISNIRSRIQCHSTILQMALQTATLAIICMTNDNVINVVNPKLDSILPLVEKVESLIKQFEKLPSQLTAMHEKHPKDFHNSDMAEYTRQLKQSAEATIMTASTIIDSQSTIVNGKTRQQSSSSSSGEFSHELRKRKIEEWISHLAVNHEGPGLDFDSISELMPDDSISCIHLDTNRQSQKINGAGMPGHLPRTSKSAETLTNMNMKRKMPVKGISEEKLAHMNLDGRSPVSTEEDIVSNNTSEKTSTKYEPDLNVKTSYDEKSVKKLLLALMQNCEAKEWTFNDAFLEVAKMEAGNDVRSSANIVRTLLYILEKGADVNAKDAHGETALHHVSKGGNTAVLNLLVKRNPNINIKNKIGWTALHFAAAKGYAPNLEILLNNSADIEQKTDPNQSTALLIAAYRNQISIVEYLLKAGASVESTNNSGWTSLKAAASEGHTRVVEILLKAGALVDSRSTNGRTSLMTAASKGHTGVVEILLKAGASIDAGNNPLRDAAAGGHLEIAQVLLKAGASADAKHNDGNTPLHVAAADGYIKIAEMLLKAGASVDAQCNDGYTPLMYATQQGHRTTIELLLAVGAYLTARSNRGNTALYFVLRRKHPEDCGNKRCAFCAASESRLDIVKLLCEKGADPSAKNQNGISVLSYLRSTNDYPQSEQRALIKLLEGFGAK